MELEIACVNRNVHRYSLVSRSNYSLISSRSIAKLKHFNTCVCITLFRYIALLFCCITLQNQGEEPKLQVQDADTWNKARCVYPISGFLCFTTVITEKNIRSESGRWRSKLKKLILNVCRTKMY